MFHRYNVLVFIKKYKINNKLLLLFKSKKCQEKRILNEKERIERNMQIAESFYKIYSKKIAKDGAVYEKWVYSPNANYWPP